MWSKKAGCDVLRSILHILGIVPLVVVGVWYLLTGQHDGTDASLAYLQLSFAVGFSWYGFLALPIKMNGPARETKNWNWSFRPFSTPWYGSMMIACGIIWLCMALMNLGIFKIL